MSFDGCKGRAPVAKLGMAFVAWTRATSWSRMCFHKLPPFADFLAARLTREFSARADFEHKADVLFVKLLERRGMSAEALVAQHEKNLQATTLAKEGRHPTNAEITDLRAMLSAVGVAPVSDSAARHCEHHSGRKGNGLWSFVASFRAEKKSKPAKGARRSVGPGAAWGQDCGGTRPASTAASIDENNAAQTMADMGFKEADITRALEQTSFQFQRALLLLLNGLDASRSKYDTLARFRRHSTKTVREPDCAKLGNDEVTTQYSQRARNEFNFEPVVLDLGQYAGRTTGACFWLCLAAGLAECAPHVLAQALPGISDARGAVAHLGAQGVRACAGGDHRRTSLGVVAETLRTRFCGGEAAVLLRDDMKARIYHAFAALDPRGPKRTEQMYLRWVQKLATREYADELVVLCVALELGIRITIIPYTPPSAIGQWAVTTYGREDAEHVLHFGNNDAHYVYLSQAT